MDQQKHYCTVMKVALASDHAGFTYKELIKEHLLRKGFEVKDYGTFSDKCVDYPDFIKLAAHDVASNKCHLGIGVCGSGIGVSITANKFRGIRAALVLNTEMASLSRKHNNSNFLALGERLIDKSKVTEIVDEWLNTEFEGGRHQIRIDKIE